MGLKNRGAIYIPFAQAIPKVPVIDREACIKFKTGKCGICSKLCPAGAIDYAQTDELITENTARLYWQQALKRFLSTSSANTATAPARMLSPRWSWSV